jgi:hypothetical protein
MTGVLALKQSLAQEHVLGWTSSYSYYSKESKTEVDTFGANFEWTIA